MRQEAGQEDYTIRGTNLRVSGGCGSNMWSPNVEHKPKRDDFWNHARHFLFMYLKGRVAINVSHN